MFDDLTKKLTTAPAGMAGPQTAQPSGIAYQNLTDPSQLSAMYGMFGGPSYWASQGYTGGDPGQQWTNVDRDGNALPDNGNQAEWLKFLKDKGYGYNYGTDADNFRQGQLTQNGTPVAGVAEQRWSQPNNDFFNATRAVTLAGLLAGGAVAAGGSAGAGGGAAAGAGGGSAGLSSAELAALYGAEGYGATGAAGGGLVTAGNAGGALVGTGASNSVAAGVGTDLGASAAGASTAGLDAAAIDGLGAGMSGAGASSAAPGFWSSLASGNYGGAASAAGNWATSPSGLQTLGGLGSAYLQNNAAGNALDAQRDATAQANALQKYMYDTTRADYAPYRQAGTTAVGGLTNLLQNPNSITSDPGYKFGLNQGQTAVDRSAASRGGLYSGATLKALQRFGTDYSSTKLNDSFNRLASVAQLGATGTAGTAQAGSNYVNQSGANTTGLGNAAAGNALYQGNIWGNALNGAVSAYNQKP